MASSNSWVVSHGWLPATDPLSAANYLWLLSTKSRMTSSA